MQGDLRDKIKAATEESGITKPDFLALLKLIDQHYDKMEATITQSLQTQTQTPIEAIFDSVTEEVGEIIVANIKRSTVRELAAEDGEAIRQLIQKA